MIILRWFAGGGFLSFYAAFYYLNKRTHSLMFHKTNKSSIMKKSIFVSLIIPILLFTYGCKNNAELKSFDDVFEKTAYHEVKYETPIADHVIDADSYKDSLFFFTVHEGAALLKMNLQTEKITKLSKNGKEPGEYQSPFALQINKKELFFNDILHNKLQVIDFNGNFVRDYKIRRFVMSLRFYRDKTDLVYLLNGGYGFDNYVARNDDKTFFKVPLYFRDYPLIKAPLNIFEYNNTLYFASPFEYKIFTIDLETGKERTFEITGVKNKFDWSRYKGEKIPFEEIKSIETALWNSKPIRFEKLILNEKLYFLLTVSSIYEVETNYIIDSAGKAIVSFITKDNIMFGSYNNKIYFYETDSKAKLLKGFSEYKLKDGIIK